MSVLGKNTTTSREAVEIKQGPVDPSVFALPAGYKKVNARRHEGEVAGRGRAQPLVSTDGLAARLGEPDLRVVDVRWYLDPARQGRDAYLAGHIPGAVFLDVERDLSAPGGGRGQPWAAIPGRPRSRWAG